MNWLTLLGQFFAFIKDIFLPPVKKDPAPIPVPEPEIDPVPVPPPAPPPPPEKTAAEKLYDTAYSCLGKDVTPDDRINDDVDCADTVNTIYFKCFGRKIAIPGDSTLELYNAMKKDTKHFQEIDHPVMGAIIVAATSTGNGNLEHGHIGICGKKWIMSNDSSSGKLQANYSYQGWENRYEILGGFKSHCFLPK